MSGTPCSQNLTNRLVTKLKDLGLPNVEVSTYNVLVSHPVMTTPSTLKTRDEEGNVLQNFLLYGEEVPSSNSTGDKPSPGMTLFSLFSTCDPFPQNTVLTCWKLYETF